MSLWELLGDTVDGLDLVGRLLGARGRVLPMAAEPLEIDAEIARPRPRPTRGDGRSSAASTGSPRPGHVVLDRHRPAGPEPAPKPLAARPRGRLGDARPRVVVHLRHAAPARPGLADALVTTSARRLLNLNLEVHTGETRGFRAEDHLDSFAANAPDVRLDVVLADPSVVDRPARLRAAAAELGAPSSSLAPVAGATTRASTTRCGWRRRCATSSPPELTGRGERTRRAGAQGALTGWQDGAHGHDGEGQGRASRLEVTKPCCRKAEVATMLRFAGGLHIVGGQIVVEAELDTANAARRLRRYIAEVYGHKSDMLVLAAGGLRKRQPLRRARRRGGRDPRPPDRAHRLPRPPRPRPAAQGRQRGRRATPRPPGEAPSSPTARSPSPAARRRSR